VTQVTYLATTGLTHWVLPVTISGFDIGREHNTACGKPTTGMVRSHHGSAEHITCEQCLTEYVAMRLRQDDSVDSDLMLASGAELDRLALDRFGTARGWAEPDRVLRHRLLLGIGATPK
jgi:hypothetical protein